MTRLQRFEDRLAIIDRKMGPIQMTTENYSKAKENITQTLEEVGKTYEYFRIAGEVKAIIGQGYNHSRQKEFFDALGRLSKAREFFQSHREMKSASTVLNTIETLLKNAIGQCVAELERLLLPLGRVVELSEDGSELRAYNPMSPETAIEVKAIFELLDTNNHKVYLEVYQGVRIAQDLAELRADEEAHSDEWRMLLEDVPYEKNTHPLRGYLSLAFETLKGELLMWNTAFASSSSSSSSSNEEAVAVFVAICEATVMELQRLLVPMLLDDEDAKDSSHITRQCNSFLIRLDMLDIFMQRYYDLCDICRPNVRQESTASVTLTTLRACMVEACVDSIHTLLASSGDAGAPLQLPSDKPKRGFFGTTPPPIVAVANPGEGCDLHPITGNVLHCCKELVAFDVVYSRMVRLALEIGVDFPDDAVELSDVITTLMENLYTGLIKRADRFNVIIPPSVASKTGAGDTRTLNAKAHGLFNAGAKDAEISIMGCRRHLFLSNNLFSLLRYLQEMGRAAAVAATAAASVGGSGGGASSIVSAAASSLGPFTDLVESQFFTEQEEFCAAVTKALALREADATDFESKYAEATRKKDKTSADRLIKAKFSAFNSGLDALLAQQGEWRISSPQLRDIISEDLVNAIHPAYQSFHEQFSEVKFSKKHMKEYCKYEPNEVDKILSAFFN